MAGKCDLCCSVAELCLTLCDLWTAGHWTSLSFTISQSLLKLMSIESVMPSNHLIFCRPLLLLSSVFPTIRVFSNESVLCISFSISSCNEHSGLISFRFDWFDLFAVQGTQESSPVPQCESINSSVLSLLHSPTLTYDYWKDHSFDHMDLQSDFCMLTLNRSQFQLVRTSHHEGSDFNVSRWVVLLQHGSETWVYSCV